MRSRNRSYLGWGFFFILVGLYIFLYQVNPMIRAMSSKYLEWPFFLAAIGVLLFLIGLLSGVPAMAVPAAILVGLTSIFYYQGQTGDYFSWTYMWTLIPGFAGVGQIVAGITGKGWRSIREGFDALLTSAVLFVVFSWMFGGIALLGPYGPAIVLIAAGFYIILRGFLRSRKYQSNIQSN
jgi:hypothetical protein